MKWEIKIQLSVLMDTHYIFNEVSGGTSSSINMTLQYLVAASQGTPVQCEWQKSQGPCQESRLELCCIYQAPSGPSPFAFPD